MSSATIAALPKDLAQEMKRVGVWQDACPVPIERLSLLRIQHINFGGEEKEGELIVLDAAAESITQIFAELYTVRFPIDKLRSIHHYDGDDELSMADNNSSCFCYRAIQGSAALSLHAYGLAVDINPLQNPYVSFDEQQGVAKLHPAAGWQFLNRHNQKAGMVEPHVAMIESNGLFVWGGRWTTPIDYHHFQPPRGIAELLMIMSADDGATLIKASAQYRHRLLNPLMPSGERLQPLIDIYRKHRTEFFDRWLDLLQ